MAISKDLLALVPEGQRPAVVGIVEVVDRDCDEHWERAFRDLCHEMVSALASEGVALHRGKPESWAAGVVYTLARVNFVDVGAETIADDFGVSAATVYAKSQKIRDLLDIELPSQWYRGPSGEALQMLSAVLGRGGDLPMALGDMLRPGESRGVPGDEEPPPPADHGYELEVTLSNTVPEVRRTLRVPDLTFEELHLVLQGAFDWHHGHLHQFQCEGFRVVDEMEFQQGMAEPEDRPEWTTRLSDVLPDGGRKRPRIVYVYDFGDWWEHSVKMTRVLTGSDVPTAPTCTAGANAAPPEDCGGPWGYADLLDALADPKHPQHEEMQEWHEGSIDPTAFDLAEANAEIGRFLGTGGVPMS